MFNFFLSEIHFNSSDQYMDLY